MASVAAGIERGCSAKWLIPGRIGIGGAGTFFAFLFCVGWLLIVGEQCAVLLFWLEWEVMPRAMLQFSLVLFFSMTVSFPAFAFVMYNDFDGGTNSFSPANEWNPYTVTSTPGYASNYLGPFGNGSISFFGMDVLFEQGPVGTLSFDLIFDNDFGAYPFPLSFGVRDNGYWVSILSTYYPPEYALSTELSVANGISVQHFDLNFPLRYGDDGTSDLIIVFEMDGLPPSGISNGITWGIDNFSVDLDNALIPEPSTALLLGAGLLGLAGRRRLR